MSCEIFMIILGVGDNGTSLNSTGRGRRTGEAASEMCTSYGENGRSKSRLGLRRAEEMKYFND